MKITITNNTRNLGLILSAVVFLLFLINGQSWGQTSTQNFGTGTGSHTSQTGSTTFLPNPTSGTTWARAGATAPNAPIVLATTSNPLGTAGAYVRGVASSSGSVSKFSPMVGYTGSTEFYTSFKVLFGDASAGNTAASGSWTFYQGDGAMYSDANNFTNVQVFTGVRFTYAASGVINVTYRGGDNWINTGLSPNSLSQATVYTVEIVGNNKSSGTINYTYGGVSRSVAVQKFDLYVNGTLIGDDLAQAAFTAGNNVTSTTFIGVSSTSNVANIFVDDVVVYNSVPAAIGASLPTVITTAISNIMTTTASSGGNVTADGGASVTARGVCYSTNQNPTLANNFTTNGTGTGSYSSSITNLSPNTLYYVRAYATNSAGTAYGSQVSFTTKKTTETVSGTSNFSALTNIGSETNITVSGNLTIDVIGECNNFTITPTGKATINPNTGLIVNGNLLLESDAFGTASLIHNTADLAVTGTTTIERYLPAWSSNDNGWHLLSSPVANNALTNFTPSPATQYDFFAWDEATNTWLDQKIVANNINSFALGKAYLTAYQNAGERNFVGAINTQNVSPALSYTIPGPGLRGYNLVGNPFASALSADIDLWTKNNVENYVYVWDDANGNYKSWDGSAGTLTDGIIPAMQGFWVRTNGANPNLTIAAASRTHHAQNFYKSSISDVLNLSVKSNTNQKSDALVIRFKNGATNQFDQQHDVPKLMSMVASAPQFYSIVDSDKISINAIAPTTTNTSITLGFEPKQNGSYVINASNIHSFACGSKILLEDTKTNTTQDLMLNPVYNFTASASDNINRFIVHFDFATVSVGEITKTNTGIFAYENNIYINTIENIKQINIYNTLGQLVKSINNINGLQKINMSNYTSGYYIVSVITENNVATQKVIIK